MRFVGIDVAAERHVVAVVDETDRLLIKATPFTEDGERYAKLFGVLAASTDTGQVAQGRPGGRDAEVLSGCVVLPEMRVQQV